ncbi:hypothetical protein [Peterkaempfera bronchialis]|uniref:Membrane-associated oxidoreductase n=1 Tax=Peterkaempfera bronchialis TaxID=2126346 RepID=A0A345SSX1_9ACTN|nr:hypothetical protein [Peterkaempfera bronchialis]AXI76826.1 hypothetical protein C7M71_004500 [Peterkaempfera bronchialis]
MGIIRTLEELAAIGRQRTVSDRSLSLHRDEIDTALLLDTVVADRIAFEQVSLEGPLTVRSCHIEELVIDHIEADALLVTNSRIGRLTVRNASLGCDITITDTSLVSLDLHSCGDVHLQRLRAEQSVRLTALRGSVRVNGSRVAAMALKSQVASGRLGRPRVEINGLHAAEHLSFDDLWLLGLVLHDLDTRELMLKRVRLDVPLRTTDLRCSDTLRVNGLVLPAGDSCIADSDIRGPVDVRDLEAQGDQGAAPARLSFRNSTLARLTAGSRAPSVIGLRGTSVTGALGLPTGRSRYDLDEDSSVGDLELTGQTFRNSDQVLSFLDRAFTEVTAAALETVRAALARRNRNREVDQLYYLTRQREAALLPRFRRYLVQGVVGGFLGWGVRARNPARVLLLGILLTAVCLHLAGPLHGTGQGFMSASAMVKALVLAVALWLNVGTGAPSQLTSPGWTALAVAFTAAGLLFTTLIVGMVIRKLVR